MSRPSDPTTPVVVGRPVEPLAWGGVSQGFLSFSGPKHPLSPPQSTARAPTQAARLRRTRVRCAIGISSPRTRRRVALAGPRAVFRAADGDTRSISVGVGRYRRVRAESSRLVGG